MHQPGGSYLCVQQILSEKWQRPSTVPGARDTEVKKANMVFAFMEFVVRKTRQTNTKYTMIHANKEENKTLW